MRELSVVRFYLTDRDTVGGKAAYQALLERLRDVSALRVVVYRGIAMEGAGEVHRGIFAELAEPMPIVVEWIDERVRVDPVLAGITALVPGALVVRVEAVEVQSPPVRLHAPPRGLRVDEVMVRDVVSVRSETPVSDLVRLLVQSDFYAVPVIDEAGRPIGIVTRTDLVERGGSPLRVQLVRALGAAPDDQAAPGMTARDVMTAAPLVVRGETPVLDAVRLMVARGVKRLPVVDDAGRLVGIISRLDVLRAVGVTPAGEEHPVAAAVSARAREVMDRRVPVVRLDAPLDEVVAAVAGSAHHRVIVVDGERSPVGIITDDELVERLAPEQRGGVVRRLMHLLPGGEPERPLPEARAREVMASPVATVREDQSLAEAARVMVEHHRKLLPVVDAEGRLVGAVDRLTVLGALAGAAPAAG